MSTSTPWGASQSTTKWAPGIMQYSTASHGGFHLSPTRNAEMPAALRIDSGWYEEDCEWALVAVAFPVVFAAAVDDARRCVKSWEPDRWEAWTGEVVTAAESHVVADREFAAAHVGHYVTCSAFGSWKEGVPAGMVGVCARQASSGTERWFLVPADQYALRGQFGMVVDPTLHAETGPYFEALASQETAA